MGESKRNPNPFIRMAMEAKSKNNNFLPDSENTFAAAKPNIKNTKITSAPKMKVMKKAGRGR